MMLMVPPGGTLPLNTADGPFTTSMRSTAADEPRPDAVDKVSKPSTCGRHRETAHAEVGAGLAAVALSHDAGHRADRLHDLLRARCRRGSRRSPP